MRELAHLKGIQAFEAAARRLSFVAAARELNVTPAAVAQLVRALESWLGGALFTRSRSGVSRLTLTKAGHAALQSLTRGLDEIDAAMRKAKAEVRPQGLTITASAALATRWLVPHLDRFSVRHPDVEIRLDVTDRVVDLERHEADIGIRCGLGQWRGADTFKLMDEEIVAVCSPALCAAGGNPAQRHDRPNDPLWILKQVPIEDTSPTHSAVFPSWPEWLAAAGHAGKFSAAGLQINATAAVIQSALNGQGVALVRFALVAHDLEAGRLIRCLDGHSTPFAWSYYGAVSNKARDLPQVRSFVAWLKQNWAEEYRERTLGARNRTAPLKKRPRSNAPYAPVPRRA
ncbi:MAG: LysR substrate-binding domain-containing protein [Tagaea sp.]